MGIVEKVGADIKGKGEIVMHSRSDLNVEGVGEVLSFDEQSVCLNSVDGKMMIEGEGIKIDTLDTDRGVVRLSGRINAIYYESDPDKSKRGFWGRLTR